MHILVKVDPQAPAAVDAAARAKAESIVKQLRGGADFATLARANSDDPSSSGKGGDMEWVERGVTVEPFERAIFSIPLNAISDPIRTPEFGYHIVKVTERRPAGTRAFEEVRPELASRAANDMARDQARDEINRIALAVKNKKPASQQEFIALANARVTSNDSGWFQKADQIPGLGFNQPLAEWVFAAKKDDVSSPIGTNRGPVVVYVADVRPAAVTPLAEIRAKVEEHVREEKGREAAKSALAQMMAGAKTIAEVAAKFGGQVRTTSVDRQGTVAGLSGDLTPLVEGALAAKVGGLNGPVTLQDGAIAYEVTAQKRVTAAELTQNKATYMDTLREQHARSLRQVLIQRLRKNAKIDVNPELTQPAVQQAGV
jgi:peptidyl-prolyl cis-trans isomerase D